ncbi:MAG: DUF3794 domain-containing protein [Christensenellales bacterium]
MELLREAVRIETLITDMEEQALVEGNIALPGNMSELDNVLLVEGRVSMGSTEVLDGRVLVDGTVVFNVIYSDAGGEILSYESMSNFQHGMDAPQAETGMNGNTAANIQQVEYKVNDQRNIAVNAVVNMHCNVTKSDMCNVVSDIKGDDGVQMIQEEIEIPIVKVAGERFTVREDVALSQGMPGVKEIFSKSAFARVSSTRPETDRVAVEGDIYIRLLYIDEENQLQNAVVTVPFGDIVMFDGMQAQDEVFANVVANDVFVAPLEEGSRIMNVEIYANNSVTAKAVERHTTLKDCYSLNSKLKPSKETLHMREIQAKGAGKCTVRDAISLPGGIPQISRVVTMNALPLVTSQKAEYGKAEIEGIMFMNIVYVSMEGSLRSVDVQTAFAGDVDVYGIHEGMTLQVRPDVESTYAAGTGLQIEVKVVMNVEVTGYENRKVEIMKDVESQERTERIDGGITVYFAEKGEELWNVAKRFNTTIDIVKKYNPGLSEETEMKEGQKLLLYRPYAS